jgi:anti-anti-sigma regulatory factor
MDKLNSHHEDQKQTKSEHRFDQEQSDIISEHTIFVSLPVEPNMTDGLITLTEIVRDKSNYDVAIDLSSAKIATSQSMSKLLKLRRILAESGHKLILYNVPPPFKGIFTVTGLEGIFELADDQSVSGKAKEIGELLQGFEQSFCKDNPSVAKALNNLAQLYQATNRLKEAEPLMERVLVILLQRTRQTGYGKEDLEDAINNYTRLLMQMSYSKDEVNARLKCLAPEMFD